MSNSIIENLKTNIFPYDFVKENEVIAFQNGKGIVVSSPKPISLNIYQEIQRFLNSDFKFELCDSNKFNEILTNSYTSSDHQKNISEELTDEFNLQDFAGSINATEDLLSGNNDAPIIKLINGIISQAIKSRASDIHFEPYEDVLIIRFRIDGILKEILRQDSKIASILISRIKIVRRNRPSSFRSLLRYPRQLHQQYLKSDLPESRCEPVTSLLFADYHWQNRYWHELPEQ